MVDYKKQGKRNRQAGQRFELKVRADLESKGWIVDRWTNNVEFEIDEKGNIELNSFGHDLWDIKGKLIPAKSFMGRSRTNGFPDFVAFTSRLYMDKIVVNGGLEIPLVASDGKTPMNEPQERYAIIGVECKSNGYLDKEEKEKCKWLLKNNIFSKILIAKKGKKRGEIEYIEFKS